MNLMIKGNDKPPEAVKNEALSRPIRSSIGFANTPLFWHCFPADKKLRTDGLHDYVCTQPQILLLFFPSSSPYKPRHLKSTSEGALAFCYRFLPQTSTLCSKALQHNGQDAVLQRGFVFTGFEATLRLIPAEFLHPDSLRLPGQQGK